MAAEAVEVAGAVAGTNALSTLTTVGGTLAAVIAAAFPVMKLIERWGTTKADSSKSSAEATLYDNLRKSLEDNSKAIVVLQSEKTEWLVEKAELRSRIERLEGIERQNEQLRVKIDEKDARIAELVNEVVKKSNELSELRERIHQLEMRVAKDERLMLGSGDK